MQPRLTEKDSCSFDDFSTTNELSDVHHPWLNCILPRETWGDDLRGQLVGVVRRWLWVDSGPSFIVREPAAVGGLWTFAPDFLRELSDCAAVAGAAVRKS